MSVDNPFAPPKSVVADPRPVSAASTYLRPAFIVLGTLAAVSPARHVLARVEARRVAKTITQFGPLPEIPITWMEWLLGSCAAILVIAVVVELLRHRWAAPLALAATTLLWLYFGPGLWAHIVGDGFFEPTGTYGVIVPLQQCAYQVGATALAATLTYRRYWKRQGER